MSFNTILVLEGYKRSTQGKLERWMVPIKPGVLFGRLSHRLRSFVWNVVVEDSPRGALLIENSDTEQGFRVEVHGNPTYRPLDIDGVLFMKYVKKPKKTSSSEC